MDHDRLCSWLGLPPGSWPPDHYALLGLARGTGEVAEIEARVLDRMEQIRPHQLLHPELVTDGMNRLAQSLVCLTDPVARSAYDRSLGIPPPPFEVVEEEPQKPSHEAIEEPKHEADPLPYKVSAYEVIEDAPPRSLPLPYEVVEEEPPRSGPLPYEVVSPEEAPARKLPRAEPVRPPELTEAAEKPPAEPQPPEPPPPIHRRELYRQLAAVRTALRAWELLRPVFGTSAESLAAPSEVLLFIRALAEARAALPVSAIGRPGSPGGTVAALVRLPHVIHTLRTLVPEQREAVALDWQRGYEALLHERRRLREMVKAARPQRLGVVGWLRRALGRTPEWILLFALAATLLVLLLRRNP